MAVRDYSKGKIYKIVVDTDEEYKPYVGSTIQGLAERMGGHRSGYKSWKKNKQTCCKSYDLFDRFGVENCKIILLEEYPCDSIMKLLMKEREWFDKMECCNKCKPYTSKDEKKENDKLYQQTPKQKEKKKEYRDEHKEQFAIYIKQYSETHKSELDEYHKQYRENNRKLLIEKQKSYATKNKEQIAEKNKEYRNEHKEEIAEKKKETFTCDCGTICRKSDKARHERSLKHQNFLSSLKV